MDVQSVRQVSRTDVSRDTLFDSGVQEVAMLTRALAAVLLLVAATGGGQEYREVLVPVIAYNLPGHDGNLWSSEIHVANPTPGDGRLYLAEALPGWVEPPGTWFSCEWAIWPPVASVPPGGSIVFGAWTEMCLAERAVGGLVLMATPGLEVTSRMVNHGATGPVGRPQRPLHGFGQEIPGTPVDRLPGPGRWLLPALLGHPDACTPQRFTTAVGFANPSETAVRVELTARGEQGPWPELVVAGVTRTLPVVLEIAPRSWRQLSVGPPALSGPVCSRPGWFDLELGLDGRVGVYASVVDRSSEDPRTVLPVPLAAAPP